MNKRLFWADSLKGILIVLVVLGHAIQETLKVGCFDNHVWNYIYSFHMPAFIAVSGFLNYRIGGGITNRLSIVYRRFRQLLVPFFCWALIRILIKPPYQINSFVNAILYPDGSFWFLWVLFFITMFFYIGDWIAERLRIKQEIVIATFCLVFALLMVFADIRILGFQFIAYYFLFYSLGFYMHKYHEVVISNGWVLAALTVVWIVMAFFWNMHKLPSFLSSIPLPQLLMQYAYRFLTALVAIIVLFGVSPKVLDKDDNWNVPLLYFGKISLGIYTTHILLMPIIVREIMPFIHETTLIIILTFIVALVVSWFIVWIINQWKVTARLLLGKL